MVIGISICLLVALLLVVLAFVIATCTTKHNPFNFDLHLATLIFCMLFRDIYSHVLVKSIADTLQGGVMKYRQNRKICIYAIVVVLR